MQTRVQNIYTDAEFSKYGTIKNQAPTRGSILLGKVVDNNDPLSLSRVKVRVPGVCPDMTDDQLPWAVVSQTGAGAGGGACIIPEVGTTVLVMFMDDGVDKPVVLGSIYTTGSSTTAEIGNSLQSQTKIIIDPDTQEPTTDEMTRGKPRVIGRVETPLEGQDVNHAVVYKGHNGSVIYVDSTTSDDNIVLQGAGNNVGKEELRLSTDNLILHTPSNARLYIDDVKKCVDLESAKEMKLYMDDKRKCLDLESTNGMRLFMDDEEEFMMLNNPDFTQQIMMTNADSLTIKRNDYKIVLGEEGVVITTGDGASVNCGTNGVDINAGESSVNIFNGVVTVKANTVNIDAETINLGEDDGGGGHDR